MTIAGRRSRATSLCSHSKFGYGLVVAAGLPLLPYVFWNRVRIPDGKERFGVPASVLLSMFAMVSPGRI